MSHFCHIFFKLAHLYVDPSLIDYYSTGLASGGNARKDENKENIGSKK